MKFKPLHDRVVVRRIDSDEKSSGGIIIPDTAKEKPSEGEVLAVGKGRLNNKGEITPLVLKKGDKVLFSKYGGNELSIDGDDLMIMEEHDVLGARRRRWQRWLPPAAQAHACRAVAAGSPHDWAPRLHPVMHQRLRSLARRHCAVARQPAAPC